MSFINSEYEEVNMSPRDPVDGSEAQVNSYGRPIAAISPTPRVLRLQSNELVRPIPTYPPDFLQESSNYQRVRMTNVNNQTIANPPTHGPEGTHL